MASTTLPPEPVVAGEPDDSAKRAAFWRVALLIGLTVFVYVNAASVSGLKMFFLYKNVLGLSASTQATIGIVVGIPSYLRPFMGAGADLFALLGFHRRSYYFLSWLLYAAGYFALAVLHTYHLAEVVCLVLVTVAGINLLYVIIDAVMVSIGNLTGQVGRLQTIQQGLPLILGLAYASVLSGYAAQHWTYTQCFLSTAVIALVGLPLVLLIDERRVSFAVEQREIEALLAKRREDRSRAAAAIRSAASSWHLWAIVGYVFYLILTPGTNTAQMYYQVDRLHFSKQFIGNLGVAGSAGSIVAILLFIAVSRIISVRTVVWTAYLMDCSLYLISFALRNHMTGIIVAFAQSFLGMIYNLALLTLAARATPKGVEATVYGLVMAATYLAGALGEKIGASIYTYFGPPHYSTAHGWFTLLWFGFAFTVIAAIFIPFLPAWARSKEPLGATVQHSPE